MKKRRTRKQKIAAKRKPVKLISSPIVEKTVKEKKSKPITLPSSATENALQKDPQTLSVIKGDMWRTVLLSALIFGLILSINVWWN